MKRLGPLDAAWLQVDSRETPMQVGSLTIYSLPPGAPDDFMRNLVAHLRSSDRFVPPFSLKLRASALRNLAPVMVEDDNLDLDYHLRHSSLPKPGGERELGVLISRLHSHPMDFSRPLWECHVIEGLENNRFALYMKMHHALIDGVGGMRLLQKMLSYDATEVDLPPPWAYRGGERRSKATSAKKSPLAKLSHSLAEQFRTVPDVTRAFRGLVRDWWKHENADDALPFTAPKSVLNKRISGQRRFATQHYDLDRIRAVAKSADATVNDVFLAMCGGALRRYLLEMQVLPDAPLTAGIPVSVRAKDSEADAGNAISFIVSTLATHLPDPVQRLEAIRSSTRVAKKKLQALPKTALSNYTIVLMAPYILQMLTGLAGRARPMFNLTVSNVPGPDRPMYFNGAKLEQMYPVSLLSHGQALNITVVSYAGQFNVGFTGCRDTLPHMQRLAVYAGESLAELEETLAVA